MRTVDRLWAQWVRDWEAARAEAKAAWTAKAEAAAAKVEAEYAAYANEREKKE